MRTKSRGFQRWVQGWLAACTLGWAAASAAPESLTTSARQILEVSEATATEARVGDWLLVQPDREAPWQLVQVERGWAGRLELRQPLADPSLSSQAQVRVLRSERRAIVRGEWQEPGSSWAGVERRLALQGQAHPGDWVVVFVDGVEVSRVQVDTSGEVSEVVAVSPGSDNPQVQWVTGSESGWDLSTLAVPSAPVVLEPGNESYTNDTTPLFRGTAEPGVTILISISQTQVASTTVGGAGNWSVSSGFTLTDRLYTASIKAQSTSGELSTETRVTFVVDTKPPVTSIATFPSAYHGSASYRFYFTVNDYGFSECSYDGGGFQRCTSPYDVSNMTEGPHSLSVRSTDMANNVEVNPNTVNWTVDLTPPDISLRAGPPRWTNQSGAIFAFESTEAFVTFECKFNGGTPFICESGKEYGFYEGPNTFQVRAKDRAGLYSDWTPLLEWTADFDPPEAPVLLHPATGVLLATGTPTFSGTAEALGTVTISADDTQLGTATVDDSGNWTFTPPSGLKTGTYVVTGVAKDQAGNASPPSASRSLRIDVDVPDTEITTGPQGFTQEANPQFAFFASEQGIIYECSIGEEPFGPCTTLMEGTRSFEPGRYMLRVRARDEAGNVDQTPATREWFYNPYRTAGSGVMGCSSTAGVAPLLPLALLVLLARRSGSRRAHQGGVLLALTAVFLGAPARAQGVELQQYKPGPGAEDVLGAYSPRVDSHLKLSAGVSVSYARDPLTLRDMRDGHTVLSIVSNQFTTDVLASLSLFKHFELGLAIPFTIQGGQDSSDLASLIPERAHGAGLGDMRLVPKAALTLAPGLDLGLALPLSLPTGGQGLFGTGGVSVQPTLLVQWAPGEQLRLLANVGGRFQSENRLEVLDMNVGNTLTYALGARWSHLGSKLFVQASLAGAWALNDSESAYRPLELLAGAGYALPGGLSVQAGGGPGLTGGYGTPSFRLFAGLSWASPLAESKASPSGASPAE
jgi:hypothetical protein